MTTEIEIQVGLKSGMADPEGVNVKKALDLLGFDSVKKVDSVKCYRIIIDKNEAHREASLNFQKRWDLRVQ